MTHLFNHSLLIIEGGQQFMKKYTFILLLVYIVSILAITMCVEKINALSILGIFACQLIVSVILLILSKNILFFKYFDYQSISQYLFLSRKKESLRPLL